MSTPAQRIAKNLLALLLAAPLAWANPALQSLEQLPPGEQFRQLSLMLLISGGAGPGLMTALEGIEGAPDGLFDSAGPDDFKTPLIRIVDQASLLRGASSLMRFAHQNREQFRLRLDGLQSENPLLIARVPVDEIMEDAIVIRHAIADAMEAPSVTLPGDPQAEIEQYRIHTLYLRNQMEFAQFHAELDRLTSEAIGSVGGKMDAYQRMFDDEIGADTFDRHIEAAEYIYQRRHDFDPKAGQLTEKMIENMIWSESQVNR